MFHILENWLWKNDKLVAWWRIWAKLSDFDFVNDPEYIGYRIPIRDIDNQPKTSMNFRPPIFEFVGNIAISFFVLPWLSSVVLHVV